MTSPWRVALTGGIGSGKSTVASFFSDLGAPIIDSDIISRQLLASDQTVYQKIIQAFDNKIIVNKNRELDRKKIREIIFNDDEARTKIEEILHPAIYSEINKQIAGIDYPYCLVVIPLLVETNAMDRFDRVLLVDVPETIQIKRAADRDGSPLELIRKIIKTQSKRESRLDYADDIIDNTIEIDELKLIIKKLHMDYLSINKKNGIRPLHR